MERNFIIFKGEFDDLIRKKLNLQRCSLGLSYAKLGKILNVSWLTIRNWETGHTLKCHSGKIHAVSDFINGKYDARIIANSKIDIKTQAQFPEDEKIQNILKKIKIIYELCADNKQDCIQLRNAIRSVSIKTLEKYTSSILVPEKK